MLGFMLFLIFLCFLFSYFIYVIYLSTVYKNDISYNGKGKPVDNKETMRWGFLVTMGISTVLLLIVTMFSSRVIMSDFWFAMLVFMIISGVTSLLISIYQRIRYRKNNFKKINRYSLILVVLFLLFIGMTGETQNSSSNESTAAVEEVKDEADDTATNQNNEQEEKVNEDEQIKLEEKEKAEREKEEKELAAKEKAEREKEEKELVAKEKAEREKEEKELAAKEKAEREKEEKELVAKEKKAKDKEEKEAAEKDGLIPVDLYRVVDGDTVNVFDEEGKELKLRLLLIDTPETVHPNKPVEPFGPEASARLTELVNSGEQLYIEYDAGAKTDHYGRHLVYLFVGDINVHDVLLEEGLARVGYIFEQQKYLEKFRVAEQIARDQQIGIWSIPGYVNEAGEGFNSESNEVPSSEAENSANNNSPSESNIPSSQPTQPGAGQYFKNCDDLRTVHPGGVPEGHADYQPKMDRDKDGWACEK